MLSLLIRYLKNYRAQVATVFILALIEALGQTALPRYFGQIVENGVAKGDMSYVWLIGGKMLLVTAGVTVVMVVASYFSAYVTAAFTSRIRADVFKKSQQFSELDFIRFPKETILARATSDSTQMQIVVLNLLRNLLCVPFVGLLAIVNCLLLSVPFTLTLLAGFGLSMYLISKYTNRSMPLFSSAQDKVDRISMLIEEKLTGMRAIRAFNRQDYEEEKLKGANSEAREIALTANKAIVFLFPVMQAVMGLSIVLILWFGSLQMRQNVLELSNLLIFIQYSLMLTNSLLVFSAVVSALPKAIISGKRVLEILNYEPVIKEAAEPVSDHTWKGEISFDDVRFGYQGAEEMVLKDISATIPAGKTTAIVGSTGSGKSTLLKLILRFYDVNYYGAIRIDGVNIREIRTDKLRGLMSYAPQKSIVFAGSVYDNLKVADETLSEEEAEAICDMARVTEFLPKPEAGQGGGIDFVLEQGGLNLSGGQRQRVSLARAFAKDAYIYLLDDCFSALDLKTEALIRKAMQTRLAGKTVVQVAQRINTILSADQIIVLEAGQVVGSGTHQELLETCDVYRQIYQSQAYRDKGEGDDGQCL